MGSNSVCRKRKLFRRARDGVYSLISAEIRGVDSQSYLRILSFNGETGKPVYITNSFEQIFSVNRRNLSDSGPGLVVHCLWELNLITVFDTVYAAGPAIHKGVPSEDMP